MISVLATDAELEALRPEWDALWDRTPTATTFQSPRWLLPWWHQFGTGLPRVAINRMGGRLTGVLPLYILPQEEKILPLGAGTTDYIDVLGDPSGLLEAALSTIDVDLACTCDLLDIEANSALVDGSAVGWRAKWQPGQACPVLVLPRIPKLARRKLNMSRNRADRAGGWRIETADARTIEHDFDWLVRLHQARWEGRGEPGMMADPRVQAFWREATRDLLGAGLLRLQSVFVAGARVAIIAALLAPERIFFYLSGFDEAQAFVSPGTILLGAMLEQAIEEGRTEAHFLRGRETYKYVWGAVDRFNWSGRYVRDRCQLP